MKNNKTIAIYSVLLLIVFCIICFKYGKQNLGNAPRDVVYKFLMAKSVDEKSKYIISEESNDYINALNDKFSSLSEDFSKNKFSYVLEQDVEWNELNDGEYARVKVFSNYNNGVYENSVDIFYLKKVEGAFKIDPKPIIDKNYMNLNDFVLTKEKNKVFRLYAKIDNYNNIDLFNLSNAIENETLFYGDEDYIKKQDLDKINKYYSVTLKDPITEIEIQGFMEKGIKENEYAARYLNGVGFKQVIFEISNLDLDSINKIVKIDSVKSLNWSIYD